MPWSGFSDIALASSQTFFQKTLSHGLGTFELHLPSLEPWELYMLFQPSMWDDKETNCLVTVMKEFKHHPCCLSSWKGAWWGQGNIAIEESDVYLQPLSTSKIWTQKFNYGPCMFQVIKPNPKFCPFFFLTPLSWTFELQNDNGLSGIRSVIPTNLSVMIFPFIPLK